MNGSWAEALESIISSAINSEFPDDAPEEYIFEQRSDSLRMACAACYPVTDDEYESIKRRLKANIVVKMDLGVLIKEQGEHLPWLSSRRGSLDFFFWNRYKKYLGEVKGWNARVIGNLGRVSDEIVDYLGDPESDLPFQRRGLVIGDVQSGKTANYTAICNKVADAGYKVIIILTGTTENLRRQTQERLDAEFSGRKSQYFLDPKQPIGNNIVGVGKYGHEKQISAFTSVTSDFNKNTLKTLNLSLHNVKTTVLFVVKKNKSVLNNLISWIERDTLKSAGFIDLPMLLIDDEADNASVDTKKQSENPTAINDAIRKLLKLFRQASYLGITATPYANIFIDPETATEMHGDDLFPRDFIYSLMPPTNYIGAEGIFGEQATFSKSLEELDSEEMERFFPFGHAKDLVVDDLPPSMKEAIAYFLLINGVRDIRGDKREHRSMMIHVSRFTNVQNQISGLVHKWVEDVQSDLRNFSQLSEQETDKIENIEFLKKVWFKYDLAEKIRAEGGSFSWYDFLSSCLFEAVASIEVKSVNQSTGASSLNYHLYKQDGLRVIAIGGNSLSRGLTLEGLCVSFFYRKSQMYDTLLQMGRWFGYRPGYEDLFKIWISAEAIDWYGYITAAAEELKLEIRRMRDANQIPKEFGLKVRQDPNSLIVTARNKMRSATLVKRPITVSGRLLETPRLRADSAVLLQNERFFREFVERLPFLGQALSDDGCHLWRGVKKSEVEHLIREFKTHPWHLAFQGVALADFIKNSDDIDDWDVVIPKGKGREIEFACGSQVLRIPAQSRVIKATREQISISGTKVRVGAGGVVKYGLSKMQRLEAEEKFRKESDKKNIPDSAYLKIDRNPILMLHVIETDLEKTDHQGRFKSQIEAGCEVPEILFALGVGIPEIGKEKIASYMVNMIELRNYYDAEEDEDE